MASILPSSSLSQPLRRQSSMFTFHARSVSTVCTCSSSYSSLSQLPRQTLSSSALRLRSSTLRSSPLEFHQTRSLVTKLVRPFSKTKASQATAEHQLSSSTTTPPPPALPLTNLPYFVRRTPSNQLPVYLVTKAGGTRQLTKLQKTEGDVDALRNDLVRTLGMPLDTPDVQINRLNGHIIVKGWRKAEIQDFLLKRKF